MQNKAAKATLTEVSHEVLAEISGPIVMIGFGSIGRGTLPLIERHFTFDKSRMVIIDPNPEGETPTSRPNTACALSARRSPKRITVRF
jgi:homospermidine synthase